jgi:peptide deformylase
MSFPGLLVRLQRFRRCTVVYRDLCWNERREEPEGDLAELIQHEYDHLDGILATMRAEDGRSLVYRRQDR